MHTVQAEALILTQEYLSPDWLHSALSLSVVSWVMGTVNRVKGRAVVILSVDATHFSMPREISDVVGMKAVPPTPQGPRAMHGYITPAFSGSP